MGLQTYRWERNFARTPEPLGVLANQNQQRFVVHEHHALRLHYDLRLEAGGVLKSWAIPKGPSLNPRQKRLTVMVEDHPVEYRNFAEHIAEGNTNAFASRRENDAPRVGMDEDNSRPKASAQAGRTELSRRKIVNLQNIAKTRGVSMGKTFTALIEEEQKSSLSQNRTFPPLPDAQRAPMPHATYCVFDLLYYNDIPRTHEPVQWLQPQLVCEVKFAEWTAGRRLRQPIFLGLRDDKESTQCTFESVHEVRRAVQAAEQQWRHRQAKPPSHTVMSLTQALRSKELRGDITATVGHHTISLTHLDKLYWLDDGYTKGNLLRYYCEVAPSLLPYLKDRPLILIRYPNGITAPSFYQHHVDAVPAFVRTFSTTTENGKVVDYVVCENLATLLYLVNSATITQHPWHSRTQSPDFPDWIVFDLDPHQAPFAAVQEMALRLKDFLDGLGLVSYPKTSGASGLHVYVPIEPLYTYEEVAHFAELVALLATRDNPQLATLERSLKKRQAGRIYLDHLQNARGKSVVAPYSVRAQDRAPVSTPLEWQEVQHPLSPQDFTMKNVPQRLAQQGDPFTRTLTHKQRLGEALAELERLLSPCTQHKTLHTRKSTARKTHRSTGASL